ncbi:MAG: hypothetical protein K6B12_05945, partial [Clostridiales bacterium]|nr:hypothetical protein [Clostridiales bacterium]
MDRKDMFFWNEEKNRIDGFVPLDGDEAPQAQSGSSKDPEQSYDAYLKDAYREYRDEAYGSSAYAPAFHDVREAWQETDGAEPPAGGAETSRGGGKKRRRPPRMVTMGILCLCIVLAAVTGALSGIAVMQHYTAQNSTS